MVLGVIHHFHEDELPVSAVLLVQFQYSVGGGAGTGKRVENNRILIRIGFFIRNKITRIIISLANCVVYSYKSSPKAAIIDRIFAGKIPPSASKHLYGHKQGGEDRSS
jgi:hypothetical protein